MRLLRNRPRPLLLAPVVVLLLVASGCGQNSEESPPAARNTQTEAMVPDTVADRDPADTTQSVHASDPGDSVTVEIHAPAADGAKEQGRSGSTATADDPEGESLVRPQTSRAGNSPPPPPPRKTLRAGSGRFSLQLGSYQRASFAEERAQLLRDRGHPATVEQAQVQGRLFHRVFIRGLEDRTAAINLGEELRGELGLDYLVRERK